MVKLENIKKVDWQYLINRRGESLLFRSITDQCYKYFPEVTGINWTANFILRFGSGELYHSAREIADLRSLFKKGGDVLLSDFRRRLLVYIKALDKVATKIEKTVIEELTERELSSVYKKYRQAALYAHNFLLPFPAADGLLSQQILDIMPPVSEEKKQQWLLTLTYPQKENTHTREERAFYTVAQAYQNNVSNLNVLIKKHVEEFRWIGTRGYWFNRAWNEQDLRDRLDSVLAQSINLKAELKHLNTIKQERLQAAKSLLKELKIRSSSPVAKHIALAREYAYLRTWRTDILYKAGYKAQKLFHEIARRTDYDFEDVSYLTINEFGEAVDQNQKTVDNDELSRRKESFISIVSEGEFSVVSGKEWEKKLAELVEQKIDKISEIKGNSAFPGIVRGRAKLVFATEDIKKVRRGDILVAVMTFPNFVPAMEKAAAFVTDEGGILCHAAIVSRELGKPCVIGTKNATKLLKDGDMVEVDATRGIVRRISN